MLPLSPRNLEGTFRAICTQSPDNRAPLAVIPEAAKRGKVNHDDGVMIVDGGMEINDQQVAGEGVSLESDHARSSRSYVGVVFGSKKHIAIDPVPSLDDMAIEEGDVTVDLSGPFPSVVFSENVHERINHSMR
ncbi:hypothetical protein V6N13_088674 [Hibiscus sabdariffa]|uniref:Uncharacterized protein n=1 Tax=Hibiscus sabdariffa TaxID=183260 RepID=A0ABR2G005_9ROSI